MNTVSIVGSVSRQAGGLFESVRRLHQGVQNLNVENALRGDVSRINGTSSVPRAEARINVRVLGLRDPFTEMDIDSWAPVPVRVFHPLGPRAFGFAPGLFRELCALNPDLVHVHGIWQFTSLAALSWRRKTGGPLLISAHGMLDGWALRNARCKKVISWLAYERAHLRSATCIRALCDAEAKSIRALGLKNPVCVLPNGVDLPNQYAPSQSPEVWQTGTYRRESATGSFPADCPFGKRKMLLYLGRIHPKKGLANLLKAWATMREQNQWVLILAGWDQGGHEAELKNLAGALRIRWAESLSSDSDVSVLFPGPQFGSAKQRCLAACDAAILPSYSEGLPMALLEAWAHRKPVLMTPQCNLPEGFAAGAALPILPQAGAIAIGLRQLFQTNRETLQAMGSRGFAIASTRFAWPKIVAELKSVYFWMTAQAPKPDCVLTI